MAHLSNGYLTTCGHDDDLGAAIVAGWWRTPAAAGWLADDLTVLAARRLPPDA